MAAAPDKELASKADTAPPFHPGQPIQSLGRQSSIYSLTLDEFQHTLSESGKNFGSMNMDEFLNSIWTAEENQAQAHAQAASVPAAANNTSAANGSSAHLNSLADKGIAKQQSLTRQGSLSIPEPLCRKTVDQVWSEIHKNQQNGGGDNPSNNNIHNPQKQRTFGEMTLEDFLIRAGVVREQQNYAAAAAAAQFGMYQNSTQMGTNFVSRPAISGSGGGGGANSVGGFPCLGDAQGGYTGGMKRGGGGYSQTPPPVNYGVRYGQVQGLGMGSPVSPVSLDGLNSNQLESGNQYGLDLGSRGGRKRIIDGPVEKVVERRQRRMIKNRESAARSRARKQAYTVELEAELNQLKEENAHLRQVLAELERKRKHQVYEEARAKAQGQAQFKARRGNELLKATRRTSSCPY